MNTYGLIGYPLGHSFSQKYFSQKFTDEQIQDSFFELFPIPSIDMFPSLISAHPTLRGLAVTIPYKEQVIPYLSQIDTVAAETGAVNCIKISGQEMKGFNTDIIGFENSFTPLLNRSHQKALVLGTGGAAKAVQYVLRKMGMPFLTVSRQYISKEGHIQYSQVDKNVLSEYTVIINCTPVGMYPNENQAPDLPYSFINETHYLYDLVYKPAETMFLKYGKQYGSTVKNGYEMLVLQAEENWKIWNDLN
jgi:shikimate dehydrogenase